LWRRRRFKKVGMVVEIKVIRVTRRRGRRRVFSVLCVVEIGRWRSHSGGGYCSIFALSGCARVWIIFMILHDKLCFYEWRNTRRECGLPSPAMSFVSQSQPAVVVMSFHSFCFVTFVLVLEPRFSTSFRFSLFTKNNFFKKINFKKINYKKVNYFLTFNSVIKNKLKNIF
jgi:hypothetical protein